MSERQDLESVGGLHSLPLDTRQTGATEFAEIVVFIDGRSETAGILKFAGVLAQEHDAHLIGVFIQPEPKVTPAETFALGLGIVEVIGEHRAELEKIEVEHRTRFEDIVRRHGVRSEWRSLSYLSNEVGVHAYYADLVIVARPNSTGQTAGPPGLAESLVLTSGRPIIMFPANGTVSQVRRILVGWNARREAVRAVADALPLLVRAEVVEVLVVDDERNSDHGQEPGANVARHLARHGAKVNVRRVSSGGEDIGHVCQFRCRSLGGRRLWPLPLKRVDFR